LEAGGTTVLAATRQELASDEEGHPTAAHTNQPPIDHRQQS
jgi:hypothetical protein